MSFARWAIVWLTVFLVGQCGAFRPALGQDVVADVVEAIEAVAGALTPGKATSSNDSPTGGLAEALAEPLQLGGDEGNGNKAAPEDPGLKRLRPLLFRELSFVRNVCDLPVEVRTKIKTAAVDSLGEVKRGLKDQNWQDGVVWINADDNQRSDPSNAIRAKLFQVLKTELPPDTFATVEKEWTHRQNYERATTIAAAVYLLDERLRLDEKQRQTIAKNIAENWEDRFGTWRILAQNSGWNYLPNIPEKLVKPHLTEQQIEIWNGAYRNMVGMGMGDDMLPTDDLWWDGIDEPTGDLLKDLFVDREGQKK